ncbi:tubulin-specific chaperone cofactor E [Brachionus plicatilis]|uniref:Tubulin-specific chaperone cofactor E n=1 Tax=Brachionus plicatilis TaxID=10195 RepID=A0A3M7P6F9_BRAPC|nr:tubulin-specific chaperone cofactor E [Brachionus plicatilis]
MSEKSLLEAICDRYGNDPDHQDTVSDSSCSSSPLSADSSNNLVTAEPGVSFYIPEAYSPRTAHTLNIRTSISLVMSNMGIDHIGPEAQLEIVCQNVLELDLSRNELNNWSEVRKLLSAVKKLRFLNLSLNKFLSEQMDNQWSPTEKYNSLSTLILNSCFLDLELVESVLKRLPSLSELHLSSNNYETVAFSTSFVKPSLKVLYFGNNYLSDWCEVCKLGQSFPSLEHLVLSENNLRNFRTNCLGDSATNCSLFKNLKILVLNRLKINDWQAIDQLREFPQLKHVRIQNIPLLEELTDEQKYYVLVGHLHQSIDSLNGSHISNDDKENCERKYIRFFMDSSVKPSRYYELEAKHGKLDRLADVNMDISKRVYVKIKYNDKQVFERIDVRQTVGDFKKYLEKFVGHPASRFKVFYIDIEACSMAVYGPEELKHANRCLYSFNIRDNDEFEIDLKPVQVLHTAASEYQFQYRHLGHLHHHHYNSHVNTNSYFQVPNGRRIRSRRIQAESSAGNGNSLMKRSKPGLINSSKYKSKENSLDYKDSVCSASLPADLSAFDATRESEEVN